MPATYEIPMFPLGTTLLPGAAVPLQVFEPRYLALLDRCLNTANPDHDPDHAAEFGVVLIERGREVGGGDIRSMFGTVARVIEAGRSESGSGGVQASGPYRVLAVGVRRIRVVEWFPDDPYPIARVVDWEDDPIGSGPDDDTISRCFDDVKRILGLSVELGDIPSAYLDRVPDELSGDPSWASYQLAALAPIGSADRQRILGGETPADRLSTLRESLDDIEMTLRFRLSS